MKRRPQDRGAGESLRVSGLLAGLALLSGCAVGALNETGDSSASEPPSETLSQEGAVRDLVRIHQDVFDRLVLTTLSEEDCEYSIDPPWGPEDLSLRAEDYPYPQLEGELLLEGSLIEDSGEDLWTFAARYEAVRAAASLSEDPRPRLDGEGEWIVRTPGRHHELQLQLQLDGGEPLEVALEFYISDYLSGAYLLTAQGQLGAELVDEQVEVSMLCASDG